MYSIITICIVIFQSGYLLDNKICVYDIFSLKI